MPLSPHQAALYICRMRSLPAIFLVAAACTPFPDLQNTISDAARAAPYPVLTPVPPLPAPSTGAEDAAAIAARAAALRNLPAATSDRQELLERAAALRARAARIREIDIAALQ